MSNLLRPWRRRALCGIALLGLTLLARPAVVSAEDESCTEKFEKIRQKFEAEKAKATPEQAYLRIPTIMTFGTAPCSDTVEFLKELYQKEDNPGILVAISNALVDIASKDAIEAVVKVGLVRFISQARVDGFALSRMGELLRRPMSPKAEDWLLDRGLKITPLRRHEATNEILLLAAAARRSDKRISVLTREIRSASSPELQAAILESMSAGETVDRKVARMAERFVRSKNERVLTAAYDILRMAQSKTYRKYFVRGIKSPQWQVRVLSVDALSALNDKSLLDLVVPLLKDEDKRVQVSAVHALMLRGGKDVMEPLIAALDYTTARVKDDIADALARLTSRDFGPFSAQWESWWNVNRETITDAQLVPISASEFSALKDSSQEKATLLYHGLRVLSDYVAFVIDTSESMKREYTPKKGSKKKLRARTEVVETNSKKDPNKKMRIVIAKDELARVVEGLQEGKSFNIVGFDTFTADFNTNMLNGNGETLARMEPISRARALAFVREMKPGGLTNLSGALQTAFGYGDVDTVFLLSDGAPEGGGITDPEELLRAVRRWNHLSKIKINVIGFDLDETTRFLMERLADQNFGVFVER